MDHYKCLAFDISEKLPKPDKRSHTKTKYFRVYIPTPKNLFFNFHDHFFW